jgi:selenocysteine lyase/cysteine desulfurase
LDDSFIQIQEYETRLIARLIDGLRSIDAVKIFGIIDADRMQARAPTIAFQVHGLNSLSVAKQLGQRAICAWHGNYYALPLTAALGTEPEGMVRLGCMHYNTPEEIDRTLSAIQDISMQAR